MFRMNINGRFLMHSRAALKFAEIQSLRKRAVSTFWIISVSRQRLKLKGTASGSGRVHKIFPTIENSRSLSEWGSQMDNYCSEIGKSLFGPWGVFVRLDRGPALIRDTFIGKKNAYISSWDNEMFDFLLDNDEDLENYWCFQRNYPEGPIKTENREKIFLLDLLKKKQVSSLYEAK